MVKNMLSQSGTSNPDFTGDAMKNPISEIRRAGALLCLAFVLSLLVCRIAPAEEPRKEATLDAIVVRAEKPEKEIRTGDVDTALVSAFHTMIEREAFEGKMEDIAEVIEKESGIQVRRTGGLGSFSSVSLRGAASEQVMVYLDGIQLNEASGGGVDLSGISLSDVQSIEIYKGSAPIHYGNTSIGGVINIKTMKENQSHAGSLTAGYGSFNTSGLSLFFNNKKDRWNWLVSADYLTGDNDFEIKNDMGTKWNPLDDRMEERNNAWFDQGNFLVKLGCDIGMRSRLDIANQWFEKNQGLPVWNNREDARTTFDTSRNVTTLQLIADDLTQFHFNTRVRVNYFTKTEEYDDSYGDVGLGVQKNAYNTRRWGADVYLEWFSDYQVASLVLEGRTESYEPEDLLKRTTPSDSRRNVFSLGLQDSIFLFQEKLMLTPGLRCTFIHDQLESAQSGWGEALSEKTDDENYLEPQIGFSFLVHNGVKVKSNLSRYVRHPSFFELFGDRGFFMGNEELEAEKGINFDLGLSLNKQLHHFFFNRLSMEFAGFTSDVENLITRVYDSRGIGKSDNISESSIIGMETKLVLDFLEHFRLSGNATLQDTENQSKIKHFNGKDLPGRFEESYMAKMETWLEGWKFYLEYMVEKGMYYDTANLLPAEDREEVNLGISCLWKDQWLFTFTAKNLGDDLYEDFNGYPQPGRSFFITLKYTL